MMDEVKRIVFIRESGRVQPLFSEDDSIPIPSGIKLHEIRFDSVVSKDVAMSIAEELTERYDREAPMRGDLQ